MATVTNINEVLDGHVTLEVECVDRMLLNAYGPNLQVAGRVVRFLTEHLGNPVPSPALFAQIGNRFVREVKAFAARNNIPILRLVKPDRSRCDDRKVDHVRPYVDEAVAVGRFGVVTIVATQEFQWVFEPATVRPHRGGVWERDAERGEARAQLTAAARVTTSVVTRVRRPPSILQGLWTSTSSITTVMVPSCMACNLTGPRNRYLSDDCFYCWDLRLYRTPLARGEHRCHGRTYAVRPLVADDQVVL